MPTILSTSYFDLFHGQIGQAEVLLVGSTFAANKSTAWTRLYRVLTLLSAKKACGRPELQDCS